jgi:hypothetical protein
MAERRLVLRVMVKLLAGFAVLTAVFVLFASISPSPDALGTRPVAAPRDLPAPPP